MDLAAARASAHWWKQPQPARRPAAPRRERHRLSLVKGAAWAVVLTAAASSAGPLEGYGHSAGGAVEAAVSASRIT